MPIHRPARLTNDLLVALLPSGCYHAMVESGATPFTTMGRKGFAAG
jgi:hypothetical protein